MSMSRQIAERLIVQFDKEPELKARIAQALLRLAADAAEQQPITQVLLQANLDGGVS